MAALHRRVATFTSTITHTHPPSRRHPSAPSPPPYCGCGTMPSLQITPFPAGKTRSTNGFGTWHLFRQVPTLLHLLRRRRHRHRPPEQCDQPPSWLQRLADARTYVAGWNNKFGFWKYMTFGLFRWPASYDMWLQLLRLAS